MPRKRNFECPVCKKPKYKKELFTQSITTIEHTDGMRMTRIRKKTMCSECYEILKQKGEVI